MKLSAYTKRRNQKIIKIYIEMLTTECYTTYSYRCLYGVNCTLFEISVGRFNGSAAFRYYIGTTYW